MIKDFCSIGSTWNQNSWLKWAISGLIGLLLLTLLTRCSSIEDDLANKSQSLLNNNGMNWATTTLDGRDLTITGEAPNEAARDGAIQLARSVYGVRDIQHEGITLKEWFSSELNMKQEGEMLILTGSLPDQASIDTTVNQAYSLYGDVNVSNKLTISQSASPPVWLTSTTSLMTTLFTTRNLDLNVSDEELVVSGEVETETEKAQLIAKIQASYGDQFTESIEVVKTRPTAEELAAIAAAKQAEEERFFEEAKLIAEAEAARLIKEVRLIEEAKQIAKMEAAHLVEEKRLADEAEATRLAEAAKQQRLAEIEATKNRKAIEMLASCQSEFNQMLSQHPTFFNLNSSMIKSESYRLFGMIAQRINYCSPVLHAKNQYINVSSHSGVGEMPLNALTNQQRIHSAISYLENISGAHHGLLRPSKNQKANNTGNSQLYFNIKE